MAYDNTGNKQAIHPLWNRRHCTKFNGVSYPVQRAAEAVYSAAGQVQINKLVNSYLENADLIAQAIKELGFDYAGAANSPYVWIHGQRDSWDFFDMLLNKAGVVCTPGEGFGKCGQGYIRLSAFNSRENVVKALERIQKALA
jgi:LL-diaminopimelate aminotransferase